jgi:drug/metabolite transporter (DMT)-like permease
VAVGAPDATIDAKVLMGDAMLIAGGAAWAATTLLIKASGLARIATEKAFAYQIAVSVPILALAALVFGERVPVVPGAVSIAWLAYQTVWVVGVTYAIWFALVQRYSASRLSAFTFLTPLFGVAAGHMFVGDPITPAFATAVILVIAGLVLVNRPR